MTEIFDQFRSDYKKKQPLFIGGTESSDRSNCTGEPPFLSGTMVRRDLTGNVSIQNTEDNIYGDDDDLSQYGELWKDVLNLDRTNLCN